VPTTISEDTRIKLNLATAGAIVVTLISCTAVLVNTLKDIKADISHVQATCWQVGDQVEYTSGLKRLNKYINVPDTLAIMRDRIKAEAAMRRDESAR
jgi:hypothetical protein